jgi:hypothetical protein
MKLSWVSQSVEASDESLFWIVAQISPLPPFYLLVNRFQTILS